MTNRQKEDRLVESLKDPDKDNHPAKLIDKAIKDKNHIFCATDWHLWRRKVKGKSECSKRKDFDTVIKNINNTLSENDVLIYLGDLVDGEFTDKESLKDVLKTMAGKKILVLGNNDLFTKEFYKSCGFDYVVQSFVWHNVLFTHMPVKNSNDINVHGHIHGYKTYWIPYTNQIDVGAFGGRNELVELDEILKKQKAYSKTIKECPEHFNEGYTCPVKDGVSLFSSICGTYLQPDPFDD